MTWRLAGAIAANLAGAERAVFSEGAWLGWAWMARVVGALDRAAADAPVVGLLARNRPAHVAAFAANLVAGREAPVAAVERVRGARAEGEALRTWLKDRLLAYQVPVEIKVVARLPRNAALKVSLPEVKALFV